MKIGSLLLVALLAVVLNFTVLAEPEATLDPAGESIWAQDESIWAEDESIWAQDESVWAEDESDWAEEESIWAQDESDWAEQADAENPVDSVKDGWSDPAPAEDVAALEPDEAAEAALTEEPADAVAWDDFDDPEFEPGDSLQESSHDTVAEAVVSEWEEDAAAIEIEGPTLFVNGVTLGPVGVDSEGRVGRVHTVVSGDTLWDVSNAYLGTAWVWPSVWNDNGEIQNPHLIEPGDRLWISSTEIRPISDAEADAYLADASTLRDDSMDEYTEVAGEIPQDFDPELETEFVEEVPAAGDEFAQMASTDEFEIAEMDQLPVGMLDEGEQGRGTGRTVRVSMRENMGFVSDVQLKASTIILGSPSDRRHLTSLDTIYFGLGEGEVEVGDEYTLFRNVTDVHSPSTNRLIGYHVDILGWAEVIEVTGDTCVAVIRVSLDGTRRGDRVMPRFQVPSDIEVKFAEQGIQGEVAFMPANRTLMGTSDYVFVDIGAVQGVEIGTDLEVYDPGYLVKDTARGRTVSTPDRVIADLVVVTVQEESAVAFIAHTRRELTVGDSVRGATRDFSGAF